MRERSGLEIWNDDQGNKLRLPILIGCWKTWLGDEEQRKEKKGGTGSDSLMEMGDERIGKDGNMSERGFL